MKPNFASLWERLKTVAEMNGDDRLKSMLLNHERRKEYICRKLGVVSDADVNRMARTMAAKVQTAGK